MSMRLSDVREQIDKAVELVKKGHADEAIAIYGEILAHSASTGELLPLELVTEILANKQYAEKFRKYW
jgi:hypothetical protein